MIYRIGKAKVEINVIGCIDCGTQWSHAWETARVITVVIAGKEYSVEIMRCGDCMKIKSQKVLI